MLVIVTLAYDSTQSFLNQTIVCILLVVFCANIHNVRLECANP